MLTTEHYRDIQKVVKATVGFNEDLVQEIAIKLAGQIDQKDDSRDLGPWVRSSARVLVRRYNPHRQMTGAPKRARGSGRVYTSAVKPVELTEFQGATGDSLEDSDLRMTVLSLPRIDRELVLGHIWGDLTLEEAGRRIGLSKWAALRRWHNHTLPELRKSYVPDSA
jgi:DNA-directed RNA polymerase specialized sigma24 family protein